MSIFVGAWNRDGRPLDPNLLTTMAESVKVRGPDGESTYHNGYIGMLYQPFHTTPESRLEKQPYIFGPGHVITWDGRLDNREDLIAQLRGELHSDIADVAIVAAAFDRWDVNCFQRIVGDWALALWDANRHELFLARDYIGIKRLFYYATPTRCLWSTSLDSLALCGDQFSLSKPYIAGFIALHPDSNLTPYREIHSVPPGSFVRLNGCKTTVQSYWRFDPDRRTRLGSDAEYEEQYRCLFRQAVRRRLRVDSPVLADLSGGLDSSSVVCMADDIMSNEGAAAPRVDTFSYYDMEEPDESDFLFIPRVEERRGRVGHRVETHATGDTFTFENEGFVAVPGFDGRREAKCALKSILQASVYRVGLSGQGGDEVNGQALDFRVPIADSLARLKFRTAAKQAFARSLSVRYPIVQLIVQSLNLALPLPLRFHKRCPLKELVPWLDQRFAREYEVSRYLMTAAEGSWKWLPSVRDAFQTILVLAREMTSYPVSSLEKRYPYLDQTLVEFMLSIPTEQLLRPDERRSLMRRALSTILPIEIAQRRTKASAGRCVSLSLEKHWGKVKALFESPLSEWFGVIDRNRFVQTLVAAKNGKFDDVVRMLRGIALEIWLRDICQRGIIARPADSDVSIRDASLVERTSIHYLRSERR